MATKTGRRGGGWKWLEVISDKVTLDTAKVCEFLSISDDTLHRLIEAKDFPPHLVICKGKRHWALEDVEDWVAKKQKEAKASDRR